MVVNSIKASTPRQFLKLLVGAGATIRTYTSAEELILLYDEATRVLETGLVVEIGSHLGASAVVLAEAVRRVGKRKTLSSPNVYCIDTWQNDAMSEGARNTFEEFSYNTARWSSVIKTLRGYSTEVELPFEQQCDLVFIDGDHTYEGVKADIKRFTPLIRIGGVALFHDQERPGVTRAIGELMVSGQWRVQATVSRMLSLLRTA